MVLSMEPPRTVDGCRSSHGSFASSNDCHHLGGREAERHPWIKDIEGFRNSQSSVEHTVVVPSRQPLSHHAVGPYEVTWA